MQLRPVARGVTRKRVGVQVKLALHQHLPKQAGCLRCRVAVASWKASEAARRRRGRHDSYCAREKRHRLLMHLAQAMKGRC